MALLDTIRKATAPDIWSAAVRLARQGCARLEEADDEELQLAVRVPGRALPFEVYLWPDDDDWACDCGSQAAVCVHSAAAAITWRQLRRSDTGPTTESRGSPAPASAPPGAAASARVVHALRRDGKRILLDRYLERPGPLGQPGARTALRTSLVRSGAWCRPGDLDVEAALLDRIGDRVPYELWPRLLRGLADATVVTLDGQPIQASAEPRSGVVWVDDEGDGFRVRLVRDPRIDEIFEAGVVRCGGCLHPVNRGQLASHERQVLLRGLSFSVDEVGRLVAEFLPRLRGRVEVQIHTRRLPETTSTPPRLHLAMSRGSDTELRVLPTIVYGDPPVARADGRRLVLLARGRVPIRDTQLEQRLQRRCLQLLDTLPGRRRALPAAAAIDFVSGPLDRFRGSISGQEHARRFHRVDRELRPRVRARDGSDGGLLVEVDADGADPRALLVAWREGRPLVPLLEGGFAPLPHAWLEQHGWTLAELLAAREDGGSVPLHSAPGLATLLEDDEVPTSLEPLRRLIAGFQGLPSTALPAGLEATLRPYQRAGVDWLSFLRQARLGGLLADDMGLGKTLQALVAIASVPGPSLVVAPTSVLRNWQAEARRFLPRLSTCLYHGPARRIDGRAKLLITSYALLRRDIETLAAIPWRYAVLDEAQAIKNPDSQVARAARRLQAEHRLALTGTPVENRLEELWSLFSFVLPGFLGRRQAFTQRVSEALLGGDQRQALAWLRRRVRPFVLRRLKSEVATELPPRTEMILRCELSEGERALYELVRSSALQQVRAAVGAERSLGVLEALLRLRQAACHPGLLPGRAETSSSKLDLLVARLQTLAEEGHRALVFSQWTGLLDLAQAALTAAGLEHCRLDGSTRDRHGVVQRFQACDGPPVFLISLKAGGTGLNLTAADYVFHLDPWWNPAVEDQAVDRAHRIGQDRPVFSVRLVAAGTVEERIIALQQAKRELARAAIGDEGMLAANLGRDELLALFE